MRPRIQRHSKHNKIEITSSELSELELMTLYESFMVATRDTVLRIEDEENGCVWINDDKTLDALEEKLKRMREKIYASTRAEAR